MFLILLSVAHARPPGCLSMLIAFNQRRWWCCLRTVNERYHDLDEAAGAADACACLNFSR